MSTALLVFSGVAVAWAGGFLLLWAWAQPEFAAVEVGGVALREVFGMGTVNLSVAVWVAVRVAVRGAVWAARSEEHTSELQSQA